MYILFFYRQHVFFLSRGYFYLRNIVYLPYLIIYLSSNTQLSLLHPRLKRVQYFNTFTVGYMYIHPFLLQHLKNVLIPGIPDKNSRNTQNSRKFSYRLDPERNMQMYLYLLDKLFYNV